MTNFPRIASLFALILTVVLSAAAPALAVEPIKIARDDKALDLSGAVEIYRNQGENFQVSTAPGPDGIVRRIEVEANGYQRYVHSVSVARDGSVNLGLVSLRPATARP